MEAPEFASGGANAIRRAILIGTGSLGSENQCVALVRALGIASNNLTIYRVTRPRGGINDWLGVIPVSLHKLIDKLLVRPFSRRAAGTNTPQKHVPNGGLAALSPSVPEADAKEIVAAARDTFDEEGPTLVIACGQETMSCSALIRKLAPDCVSVIQVDIMLKMRLFFEIIRMRHPRFRPESFDLVVAPRHDYYTSTAKGGHQQEVLSLLQRWIFPREPPPKNLMFTVGALHQADPAALRLAYIAWRDELAPLTKPLLIVNVGGLTKKCIYGADLATQLVTSRYNVLDSCGSVRISFSRKTPQKYEYGYLRTIKNVYDLCWPIADVILQEFAGHPKVYIWDNEDPNPHLGHLAWADAFVITADSTSMLSEACSTGKPVYVIGTEYCNWRISDFHKTLRERGAARPFTGLEDISRSWSYPPLNDSSEVAPLIREAIAERGWTI